MKSIIKYLYLSLTMFTIEPLQAEVPLVQLKGLTDSMGQKFKSLSPAIGTVYWKSPYIRNIWQYGPNRSAMSKLVHELFFIHRDFKTFDCTQSYNKIARYFDSETLGHLVGIIIKEGEKSESSIHTIIDDLTTAKQLYIKETILDGFTRTIKRQQKMLATIDKNDPQYEDTVHAKTSNEGRLKREQTTKNVYNQIFWTSKSSLEKLIPAALKEESENLYPLGTTVNIFLAFLWKKSSSRTDLKLFFDTLAQELGISVQELIHWRSTMPLYTKSYYETLKTTDPEIISSLSLDDLIFARYAFDLYEVDWPPIFGMAKIIYGNYEFTDCVETALRNFLNILLYDKDNNNFNTTVLENLNAVPQLIEFYKEQTIENFSDYLMHEKWGARVSNLGSPIEYLHNNTELDSTVENVLYVLSKLLPGITSFEKLENELAMQKITLTHSLTISPGQTTDITFYCQKLNTKRLEFQWHFGPTHSALRADPLKKCSEELYAQAYKTVLYKSLFMQGTIDDPLVITKLFLYIAFSPILWWQPELTAEREKLFIFQSYPTMVFLLSTDPFFGLNGVWINQMINRYARLRDKFDDGVIERLYETLKIDRYSFNEFFWTLLTKTPDTAVQLFLTQKKPFSESEKIVIISSFLQSSAFPSHEKIYQWIKSALQGITSYEIKLILISHILRAYNDLLPIIIDQSYQKILFTKAKVEFLEELIPNYVPQFLKLPLPLEYNEDFDDFCKTINKLLPNLRPAAAENVIKSILSIPIDKENNQRIRYLKKLYQGIAASLHSIRDPQTYAGHKDLYEKNMSLLYAQ